MNKENHYNELINWAGNRIDYLSSRSSACKNQSLKTKNRLNAQALEEEFFDWFAARHSDSKQNVLFVPYHGDLTNGS
jgi:ATPase subunit of ABC transporter with duplicated ATPase domains